MKLSIVLTVYNKESFLKRSLDAILTQEDIEDGDYELLIVNDGSTDGSCSIITSYASSYPIISVINQSNQGLSMARNNGMNSAKGEYVWFVDADDIIAPQAVSKILLAMGAKPDIIPIYAKYDNLSHLTNDVDPNADTGKQILEGGKWDHGGVFNVFRKDFLIDNNLSFFPGIYHEDSEFTPRMLYLAKSVKVIPEVLYMCSVDPNGITQVPRAKRAFDYLIVANHLNEFVVKKGARGTNAGKAIDLNASIAINNAFSIIIQNNKTEQNAFEKAFYEGKSIYTTIMKSAPKMKYRIEGLLFDMFSHKSISIYKIMKSFA